MSGIVSLKTEQTSWRQQDCKTYQFTPRASLLSALLLPLSDFPLTLSCSLHGPNEVFCFLLFVAVISHELLSTLPKQKILIVTLHFDELSGSKLVV